jgi:hypothetical protein
MNVQLFNLTLKIFTFKVKHDKITFNKEKLSKPGFR